MGTLTNPALQGQAGALIRLPLHAAVILYLVHFFVSTSRAASTRLRMTPIRPLSTPTNSCGYSALLPAAASADLLRPKAPTPGSEVQLEQPEQAADQDALRQSAAVAQQLATVGLAWSESGAAIIPRVHRMGYLCWSLEELTSRSPALGALVDEHLSQLLVEPDAVAAAAVELGEPGFAPLAQRHPTCPYRPTGAYLQQADAAMALSCLQHCLLLQNHPLSLPLPGSVGGHLRTPGMPMQTPERLKAAIVRRGLGAAMDLSTASPEQQDMGAQAASLWRAQYAYRAPLPDTLAAVAALIYHAQADPALPFLCGGRSEDADAVASAGRMFQGGMSGPGVRLLVPGSLGMTAQFGGDPVWDEAQLLLVGQASAEAAQSGRRGERLGAAFATLRREYCGETPLLRCLHMPMFHFFRIHLDQLPLDTNGPFVELVHVWLAYLTPWRAGARKAHVLAMPDRSAAARLKGVRTDDGGGSLQAVLGPLNQAAARVGLGGLAAMLTTTLHRVLGAAAPPPTVGRVPGDRFLQKGVTARWATTLAHAYGDFARTGKQYDKYWRGFVAQHHAFYVHLLTLFCARLRGGQVDLTFAPPAVGRGAVPISEGSLFRADPPHAGLGSFLHRVRFPALDLVEAVLDVFEPRVVDTLWHCGHLLHGDTLARAALANAEGVPTMTPGREPQHSPALVALQPPPSDRPVLATSAVASRQLRWAAWNRAATSQAGDKLLPAALRYHGNALGVDASCLSETLLPVAESEAAHKWRVDVGTDTPVAPMASTVVAGDIHLGDVPEGAHFLGTTLPTPEEAPLESQARLLSPDALFTTPVETASLSDSSTASVQAGRMHAAGVLVMVCAALDGARRAAGATPGAVLTGQAPDTAAVLAMLQVTLLSWWRMLLHIVGLRGPVDVRAHAVDRLQHVAHRLGEIFGLEHIVDECDTAIIERAATGQALKAAAKSAAASSWSSVAGPRPQREAPAAGTPGRGPARRLAQAGRQAVSQGTARCTLDDADFLGHPSHIPVRRDEVAAVVFATQHLCIVLVQLLVALLVPTQAPSQHTSILDCALLQHRAALEPLAEFLGTSPEVLTAHGQVRLTDSGMHLVPADTCTAASQVHPSTPLLLPNFLRVAARTRIVAVALLVAVLLGWGLGGLPGMLACSGILASPLLLALAVQSSRPGF